MITKYIRQAVNKKYFKSFLKWYFFNKVNHENRYNMWKLALMLGIVDPFSGLENKYKFIFIHIPKTAGTAIIKSLFDEKSTGHYYLKHYCIYDKDKTSQYFSFALIRNPWDRFLSAYTYLKKGGMGGADLEFSDKYLKKYESFKEFVLALKNRKIREKVLNWTHFIPQNTFVCNNQGDISVSYLGKYETIEEDFNKLKMYFDKPNKELKIVNKSNHKPYWEYYDEQMVEIVGELYKKDIELFGYEFPYHKIIE